MPLHPHRIVTAIVHLEHGVRQAVIDEGRQFGMDRGQVIALVEIVADDLPVELRVGGDVEHPDPVFEAVAFQPLGIGGQPFEQRWHVVVHAPEDERAPRLAAQFGEVDLAARVAAGKIVRVLHFDQRTRRIELPAVVGTHDPIDRSDIAQHQPVPAVRAGIVEGTDRTIRLLDHDHRFIGEVVAHDVAFLLQFGGHRAQVPDLGPQVGEFLLQPLL